MDWRLKGLLARAIVVIDESGRIMCTEPVHGKAQESFLTLVLPEGADLHPHLF